MITPLGTIVAPSFTPGGGTFDNPVTVSLQGTTDPPTAGVRVYVTTDGSDPEVPDPPTVGQTQVTLERDTLLKGISYRDFFGASAISETSYTFVCADPVIATDPDPSDGPILGSVVVAISSATTGGDSTILYTLDGTAPGRGSFEYTKPSTLEVGTHVIRAQTFRTDFAPSDTVTASVIVEPVPEAPRILTHPTSQTVDAGSDVSFLVEATGVPDPGYEWMHDAETIHVVLPDGDPALVLPNVRPSEAGSYSVRVSNSAGMVLSDEAELTVIEPPTPTATPTDGAPVPAPGTAGTFVVLAALAMALLLAQWLSSVTRSGP